MTCDRSCPWGYIRHSSLNIFYQPIDLIQIFWDCIARHICGSWPVIDDSWAFNPRILKLNSPGHASITNGHLRVNVSVWWLLRSRWLKINGLQVTSGIFNNSAGWTDTCYVVDAGTNDISFWEAEGLYWCVLVGFRGETSLVNLLSKTFNRGRLII